MSFRAGRGFTLLELIVVMLLVCVAAAIAVPSMRGFGRSERVRGCTAQLVALGQWARAQAITDATRYRLNVDAAAGTFWMTVERNGTFESVGREYGRTFTAPEGVTLQWSGSYPADAQYPCLEFLPTGRTRTTASVLVIDERDSHVTEIACLSPAEPFRVLSDSERGVR